MRMWLRQLVPTVLIALPVTGCAHDHSAQQARLQSMEQRILEVQTRLRTLSQLKVKRATERLQVRLPGKAAPPVRGELVVVIRAVAFTADGQKVNQKQLRSLFEARRKRAPDVRLMIQAEADVRHGRIVEVIDLARGAGIMRVGMAVLREREEDSK